MMAGIKTKRETKELPSSLDKVQVEVINADLLIIGGGKRWLLCGRESQD